MSEELVKVESSPVYVDNTGLSDIIRLKPSRLSLVHSTTLDPQGANPGQILDVDSGTVYDSIEVVLLKSRMGRAYFPEGSVPSKDSEPLCRSMNGIRPVENVKAKQSNTCASCPKAVWLNDRPSPCRQKLELVVARIEDMMPYYLTIGGKGISPVKSKLSSISKQAQVGFNQGKNTTLQNFVLTFKGVKDGAFHHYDIIKIKPITNKEAEAYIIMVNEINSQVNKQAIEDKEFEVNQAVESIIEGEIVQDV